MSMNSMAVNANRSIIIGSQNCYSKAKLSWISDKRDDTTPTDQRCLQRGSTTVTTLDLIHRQEITHSVGGAAIRSLDFLMCPRLIGRIQTISLLQFLHLKVSRCGFFFQPISVRTPQTEREQPAASCTDQHSTTKQILDWNQAWIWTRPDQTRTTQPVRTGCCLKRGENKRKEERRHCTHTSSERAGGDTTIESKNTAVHVPCSRVCVCEWVSV